MGLFKKIADAVASPAKKVVNTVIATPIKQVVAATSNAGSQAVQAVTNPVNKIGTEIGRGADGVLAYPGKILSGTGSAIGGSVGSLFSGVAPGLASITPSLQDLIATYVDPQGYLNRKEPFPTTSGTVEYPGNTGEQNINPSNPIKWSYIIAGTIGILAIIFIYKKR